MTLSNSGEREARSSTRVLIVEDDWDSAESLEAILEHAHYEVKVAHNAVEAAAIALAFQPAIALIDINLAEVSGYEVAVSLRKLVSGCRLIASTAHCGGDSIQHSLAAGFEAHLTKPLDVPRLLRLLAGTVARAGEA